MTTTFRLNTFLDSGAVTDRPTRDALGTALTKLADRRDDTRRHFVRALEACGADLNGKPYLPDLDGIEELVARIPKVTP